MGAWLCGLLLSDVALRVIPLHGADCELLGKPGMRCLPEATGPNFGLAPEHLPRPSIEVSKVTWTKFDTALCNLVNSSTGPSPPLAAWPWPVQPFCLANTASVLVLSKTIPLQFGVLKLEFLEQLYRFGPHQRPNQPRRAPSSLTPKSHTSSPTAPNWVASVKKERKRNRKN
eukprot:1160720-Pelagomonas_calceolata.AAC.20